MIKIIKKKGRCLKIWHSERKDWTRRSSFSPWLEKFLTATRIISFEASGKMSDFGISTFITVP